MTIQEAVEKRLPIISATNTFTEVGKGQHISTLTVGPIYDARGVMVVDGRTLFRGSVTHETNPLIIELSQPFTELGELVIDRHTGHYVLTCPEPTELTLRLQFAVGEEEDLIRVLYQ